MSKAVVTNASYSYYFKTEQIEGSEKNKEKRKERVWKEYGYKKR